MSNFVLGSRLFVLVMLLLIIIDLFEAVPSFYYAIVCSMYFVFLAYGSFFIGGNVFVRARCRVDTEERVLALTFDDGPHPEHTPRLLDILRRHKVRAAFFCIGHRVEAHPDIVRRIQEEGHLLGMHSYAHSYFYDFWPAYWIKKDLQKNAGVIASVTGEQPRWFRPPYGVTNPAIGKVVEKENYQVIGWSVRSFDTILRSFRLKLNRILSGMQPGSIILMHDSLKDTPELVDAFIEKAHSRQFKVIRLDRLLQEEPYHVS